LIVSYTAELVISHPAKMTRRILVLTGGLSCAIIETCEEVKVMFKNIAVYAGSRARKIINDRGLREEDISGIIGASGGPKFLVLAGLDRHIFSTWFKKRKKPLHLLGSSIGAWRGAAFACADPAAKHELFVQAYLTQHYAGKPTCAEVTSESYRIMDMYLSNSDIDHILNSSFVRLNIIAARCRGLSASDSYGLLAAGLAPAVMANIAGRSLLLRMFQRTLFHDTRGPSPFSAMAENRFTVPLTKENIRDVILASGSIPLVMEGIRGISGAPEGTYRDGGLTDYHPVPVTPQEGIILYPHFTERIVPGWLDKSLKWRKPAKESLADILLIAPSKSFLESIPFGKIPDRTDFVNFAGRDSERLKYWNEVIAKSSRMGEEFIEAAVSGKIRSIMMDAELLGG